MRFIFVISLFTISSTLTAATNYVHAPLSNPSFPNSANMPMHAMAVDSDGKVYIQQVPSQDLRLDHTIKVYSSEGNFISSFVLNEFYGSMTLKVHGNKLYAGGGNFSGSVEGIMSFDLNGNYISTNLYPDRHIRQLDFNSSGSLAASHMIGSRFVKIYDLSNSVTTFQDYDYGQAQGLSFDLNDNLYTDDVSGKIKKFDSSGNLLWQKAVSYNPWNLEATDQYLYASVANSRDYVHRYSLSDGSYLGQINLNWDAEHLESNGDYFYVGGYDGIAIYDIEEFDSLSAVPEPSSYALILGGLALGLVAVRRR